MTLLHALVQLNGPQLCLAHINHRLRGRESAADERFCRRLAADYRLPIHLARGTPPRGNIQGHCRRQRLTFFETLVKEGVCQAVVTAHHRDDRVEQVMLRLWRGCSPAGLSSFGSRRGILLRPFYELGRDEIKAYARRHGLTFREDSSNRQDKYLRNYLRHRVLPLLAEGPHGPLAPHLLSLAEQLRQDEKLLQRLAVRQERRLVCARMEGELGLDRSALAALPPALSRRLLHRLAGRLAGGPAPGSRPLARALRAICQKGTGMHLPLVGAVELDIDRDRVWLRDRRKQSAAPPRRRLKTLPQRFYWPVPSAWLNFRLVSRPGRPHSDRCYLPWPDDSSVYLRTFRPGDFWRPPGLYGRRQKLGDYFTNHKVPRRWRRCWPLLARAGGEVLAVLGQAVSFNPIRTRRWLCVEGLSRTRAILQFGLK